MSSEQKALEGFNEETEGQASEWEEAIFSDVIDINDYPSVEKGEEYKSVGMSDVARNKRKIQNWERKEYSYSRPRFRNGQTLMARITPCLENGKTAFVDILDEDEAAIGSTEFIVLSDTEKTIPKFVYYTARRPEIRQFAIKRMTGTSGRQRVPLDIFDKKKIKLPSLPEQRKIVDILDSLDAKLELNNQIEDVVSDFGTTLMQKMEEERETEKIEISEMGEIVTGNTPSTKENEFYGGEFPFITVSDFDNKIVVYETEKGLTPEGRKEVESKKVPKDAVMVSCIGTDLGKTGITSQECVTNQQINTIIPSGSYGCGYTYFKMKSLRNTFQQYAGGSAQPILSKSKFGNIEIEVLSENQRKEFNRILNPLLEQIKNIKAENKRLKELRDTLLPKLMSGEIRVNVDGDE
ncbi:restriction endonuclease subunit S [Candidatus Nanosalina sp. VS9-1]|uniref:restriction endonuclease subunit S n=1 Tax=Candidatus Nanosalina sp. VS9-1 TaxID=3388566 RepID=UPI0039E08FF0